MRALHGHEQRLPAGHRGRGYNDTPRTGDFWREAGTIDASTGTDLLIEFISILTWALLIAIIIRALLSWFSPNDGTGFSRVLAEISDPILGPIRRVMPPVGGLDLSPLLAIIAIQLVSYVLTHLLASAS